MENLLSVGIDVGTTTTQVVFSRLTLENTAGYFSVPRVSIINKEIIYEGPVHFTPLRDESHIDAEAVKVLVLADYAQAGVRPAQVSAGAVIITGESARKDNAAALVHALAGLAGEFVVSAAGPDLEAVIAGKGSGACAYSRQQRRRVLNLDVGGGTSNAALFDQGETVVTGCMDVGGRLVRTDAEGAVLSFSPGAARVAEEKGIPLYTGMRDMGALEALCAAMAKLLAQQAGLVPRSPLYHSLKTPHSADFDFFPPAEVICFSGGVADTIRGCFSSEDCFRFGDIGILLGRAVAQNEAFQEAHVLPAEATLRATVIGAGSYTTAVSGSTIHVSEDVLPLHNLMVYRCTKREQALLSGGGAADFIPGFRHALSLSSGTVAIALLGWESPEYADIKRLAEGLVEVADACLPAAEPLVVVSQEDMAKALGQCLRMRTKRPLVSIDGIAAQSQDYLDIGKPLLGGLVVPVVVKTLLFGQ